MIKNFQKSRRNRRSDQLGQIVPVTTDPVSYLHERDFRLARLIDRIGEVDCAPTGDGFANLAHSIIEQMLSTKVANTMQERLLVLCGGEITPASVSACTIEEIKGIGVSRRKAECLHHLANNVTDEDLASLAELEDEEVLAWLTALPGIGEWTAHMFMPFHLGRPDVLPTSDLTFRKSFEWLYGASVKDVGVRHAICDLWHPCSSYAARYLYRALDDGLVDAGPAPEILGF